MAEVTIRPARPEEFTLVGELTVDAYTRVIPPGSYADTLRDAAARAAVADLLVAEVGDRVVGTVTFTVYGRGYAEVCRPGEAEVRMLAVDPAQQQHGVATALMHACADRARALGCRALRLSTTPQMTAAQRLYERLGYVRAPEDDRVVGSTVLLAYTLALS